MIKKRTFFRFSKIVALLFVVEIVLIFVASLLLMADSQPSVFGIWILNLVKYFFGFPLVLFNDKYPFFLDSKSFEAISLVLVAINNSILAFLFIETRRIISRKN